MKYKNVCDSKMTFQECELAILRAAVDIAETRQGKKSASSPEIKRIITIVEAFLKKKSLVCYGGTAINNILPKQDQFYNKDVEIPDYDFYSPNALNDAKSLVDDYIEQGFIEVEAKSGQHHGTYKVFVNFIPVADISYIPKELFNSVKKESVMVAGILYAPPNFLRMAMYLELSRPAGDVSRWEKVLKRLILLNKHYPLSSKECGKNIFQREMDNIKQNDEIYETVLNTLIDQSVVFFGGHAISMYSNYMPKHLKKKLKKIPDFDVLSEEPLITAQIIKERLNDTGIKNVQIIKLPGIGEIIAPHYYIKVDNDAVAFIYEPLACHSYNVIKEGGNTIKIATIDTMLSFYLAFLYVDKPYYDKSRILCMSNYLFKVQDKNRLTQKGLLRRFSINCVGEQQTLEGMRAQKAAKYLELKDKKGTAEYDEWFLRYRPGDNNTRLRDDDETIKKKTNKRKTNKKKTNKKKTNKRKTNKRKTNKKRFIFF